MKLGKYKAISRCELGNLFLDYVDALGMPLIDYVAIGVQDTIHKTSSSIMSRLDWQDAFHKLGLAEHDPVRKASFNTNAKIFSFDELDCQDSQGKEVMRQRKCYGIENGIVLMRRELDHNFMLTLATGFKHFRPQKFFLENQQAISKVFDDLICLLTPSAKEYQPIQLATHLNVDAK